MGVRGLVCSHEYLLLVDWVLGREWRQFNDILGYIRTKNNVPGVPHSTLLAMSCLPMAVGSTWGLPVETGFSGSALPVLLGVIQN